MKCHQGYHSNLIFFIKNIQANNTNITFDKVNLFSYSTTTPVCNGTYIVITGATRSRLAMRMPISDIANVRSRARNGSPRFVVTEKKLITGITPSIAMACNSLGAPVNMQ